MGDILGIFALAPDVRLPVHFAFNPKRLTLNPIEGKINDGFELVESISYLVSRTLDDDVKTDILTAEEFEKEISNK